MPGSEFVAVVAGLRVAGFCSEIVEVRCRTSGMKLVIAGCGAGAGFYAAPRFVVAGEVFLAAIRIGQVAYGHDSAADILEQFCRGFRAGKILAVGDVTRTDEDGRLIRRRRGRGQNCRAWRERCQRLDRFMTIASEGKVNQTT